MRYFNYVDNKKDREINYLVVPTVLIYTMSGEDTMKISKPLLVLNVRQRDTTISSMRIIQKSLSPLDQEIMNIVWECNSCTVREVLVQICKEKELAYTTVATILTRLCEKGLLKRSQRSSVVYYSPKISREDFSKNVAGSFFTNFLQSFGDTAIASFAESIEELPKEKKEYFLKLLERTDENT